MGTGGAVGSGGDTAATGGTTGSGGNTGAGGSTTTGSGGASTTGGTTGTGGGASGGSSAAGGNAGSGGAAGRAGTSGSGGTVGSGGSSASGGTVGSGGSSASAGTSGSGVTGPCDIYQSSNTPCAAAHSTARALYAAYAGPLYQLQRASDKSTKDVPVGPGGYANTSVQDSFCSGTTCTIPIIYDQSPNGNHLRVTWFSNWLPNGGTAAVANAAKITMAGHIVYGIKGAAFSTNVAYRTGTPLSGTAAVTNGSSTVTFSSPQTLPANTPLMFVAGVSSCQTYTCPVYYTSAAISASTTVTVATKYSGTSSSANGAWNQATKGVPTGDQAEAMYSVFDGTSSSSYCCFDYGNAELDGVDDGNATMEAIYWGSDTQFGQSGGGNGPWVAADLENGMYEGYENGSAKVPSNTSVTGFPYVTAVLKGLSASNCPTGLTSSGCFELKAGNATSGKLAIKFNADTMGYGSRPLGYSPQKKQGAVILGTGGDGSNGGTGIWFEGAITVGAPPDATDDAVQANIVAAGYGH